MAEIRSRLDAVDVEANDGEVAFATDEISNPAAARITLGAGPDAPPYVTERLDDPTDATTEAVAELLATLDGAVTGGEAEPVTDRSVILVADPAVSSRETAPWPAPVPWSAMAPVEGEARCTVVEGDEARAVLAAVEAAGTDVFETGEGDLVVLAGARATLPSEDGCPS